MAEICYGPTTGTSRYCPFWCAGTRHSAGGLWTSGAAQEIRRNPAVTSAQAAYESRCSASLLS
jgi:hypothetical protein